MRIDAYNQISQLYQNSSIQKSEDKKTSKLSFKDELKLSSQGIDAQLAKQAVSAAPDIRMDVVGPIKEQIDNGTYDVDTDDFAGKLLEKYGDLF